jgi:hypothetical protein
VLGGWSANHVRNGSFANNDGSCPFGGVGSDFYGAVLGMPKWVVYCGQCNRASPYNEIDVSTIDLASPTAKKPELPSNGERWECPFCKKKSHVRECDLTYSHA